MDKEALKRAIEEMVKEIGLMTPEQCEQELENASKNGIFSQLYRETGLTFLAPAMESPNEKID